MWTDGWAAFDTETTGLGTSARIVEVAVVTFDKGVLAREWSQLLCPRDVDWDSPKVKEALAVNRLTREELQDKPSFEQVLPDLLLELSHPVWVAHNLEFDLRMLNQELKLLDKPAVVPQLGICTKNLAAWMNHSATRNRLADVACRFNVIMEAAHRATADAVTCSRVLAAMLQQGKVPTDDAQMKDLCERADQQWKGKHRWT